MPYGTVNTDIVADSSGGKLAPISSVFRNRLINGNMVIAQRTTASINVDNSAVQYPVDRFFCYGSQASSKFSVQQTGVTLNGFTTSIKATSSSAYSVASGDNFYICQNIEGYNVADLNWGTANAKTVTLSFQVYSSLTGTFGGALLNDGYSLSYPFSYSIPVANTWTTISVTIAGPTTSTWLTNNGVGIRAYFSLGTGTTGSSTAGSWQAGTYYSATGATSVVGTSGATFYITGVQLEVGSSATGFEYENYTSLLNKCYRYYYYLGGDTAYQSINTVSWYSAGDAVGYFAYPVTMRAAPSISKTGTWTTLGGSGAAGQDISGDQVGPKTAQLGCTSGSSGTSGQASTLRVSNDLNFRLAFSAEL